MTVISAIITKHCIAVASDSFITRLQDDGTRELLESEESKIVPIPKLRTAASYWGLALVGDRPPYRWSTYEWLKSQARVAHRTGKSLEKFAEYLRSNLEAQLSKMVFKDPLDKGIGIHLTGYENIDGYWIPELFLISNFEGPTYSRVRDLRVSRETFGTICKLKRSNKHRERKYRMIVHEYLQEGNMLIYNNGDPVMFNPAAYSFIGLMRIARARGKMRDPDSIDKHLSLARRPVEIVSDAQRDFYLKDQRLVGGKPHDLAISRRGKFHSTTGDDKL